MKIIKGVLEIAICEDKKLVIIVHTPDMDEVAKRYYGFWLLYKKYDVVKIEVPDNDPEGLEDKIKEIIKKHCYHSYND
jgi:glutathione peroxidase-family protein